MNKPLPMISPVDSERCVGHGFADGFAQAIIPAVVPERPRVRVAQILNWPIDLVTPLHLFAYFDGTYEGRLARLEEDTELQ